ncbi:MAG: hypothetical protein QNJ31_07915, partial [Candidatus Caenarcaniphilales bacterium]|nr:hypothetical protein [Candidatus Caenarcaniphilales bacterium]
MRVIANTPRTLRLHSPATQTSPQEQQNNTSSNIILPGYVSSSSVNLELIQYNGQKEREITIIVNTQEGKSD